MLLPRNIRFLILFTAVLASTQAAKPPVLSSEGQRGEGDP